MGVAVVEETAVVLIEAGLFAGDRALPAEVGREECVDEGSAIGISGRCGWGVASSRGT